LALKACCHGISRDDSCALLFRLGYRKGITNATNLLVKIKMFDYKIVEIKIQPQRKPCIAPCLRVNSPGIICQKGATVMISKMSVALLLASLLFGCGLSWKDEGPPPRKADRSPEIISFQAEQTVRPGETWRIYLKLRDADCDMAYVVTQLWQLGAASYPVSFTPIRQPGCPELVGYIFLRTPADRELVWNQFEAKVFIRDRQGNHSNSIDLPLNFDWIPSKKQPEQWQNATMVSIGSINVDLANTLGSAAGR
jgi:hypothetical protein